MLHDRKKFIEIEDELKEIVLELSSISRDKSPWFYLDGKKYTVKLLDENDDVIAIISNNFFHSFVDYLNGQEYEFVGIVLESQIIQEFAQEIIELEKSSVSKEELITNNMN